MIPPNYRYFVRGCWAGRPDEQPAVTGAKFLKALDLLSGIDPMFSDWQVIRNWRIAEDERPRQVPLATVRDRIAEIVEDGVALNDFNKPSPREGYSVAATAGARGSRNVACSARTDDQSFELRFGEHYLVSDLSIVTYPLFKAALQTLIVAWDAQWAEAQVSRNDMVKIPMDFGPGVPAFRIESAPQVPLDPTFPKSIFQIPWIIYLSAQMAAGVALAREILTERTPDGGLLMSAATERLDPANPEHARRARILAETLIARTGVYSR
jgi:hypothetical protein